MNYIELINHKFQENTLFLKATTAQLGAENVSPYNEWSVESNPGNIVCYNITRATKLKYLDSWNEEVIWQLITLLQENIFIPDINLKNSFINLFKIFDDENKYTKIMQNILNIQYNCYLTSHSNYIVDKHYFIIQADLDQNGAYIFCEIIANLILKQRKINSLIQVDLFNKHNIKFKEWKIE